MKKAKKRNPRRRANPPVLSRLRTTSILAGGAGALIILFIAFFFFLVPLNLRSVGFWITLISATAVFAGLKNLVFASGCSGYENEMASGSASWKELCDRQARYYLLPIGFALFTVIAAITGISAFHAGKYASLLTVQDAVFSEDLAETLGTDSIALMDTASAQMLGDREIGSLAGVVSQYNVSEEYTQIDLAGTPKKVAALEYAGFIRWFTNRNTGVPGYVTVDPVSMSASYHECEKGMLYVPSAYLLQDTARYIRLHYPTVMFGNLHFEVDEEGNPYYVASVYEKTISLFGGETVKGAIVLDPVTGDITNYALGEIPAWIDDVFDGDLICTFYNWHGTLQNGFINSLIGKKGCKQVTTYRVNDEDDEDDIPTSDYGYVAKDGDIWIYTGVTSVNGDSSNIGFLMANERTGEARYYTIAGADENSAMAAAEGEVQEKGYQASFPSLINVDGNPTYIMVLKDASGLVKLYAAVNVEQYNLVTTASTQAECMSKYRALLGLEAADETPGANEPAVDEEALTATSEAELTIRDIRYIDIDGNTWIYLIGENEEIYKAKASSHEEMLLLHAGDKVHLTVSDTTIITCEKTS